MTTNPDMTDRPAVLLTAAERKAKAIAAWYRWNAHVRLPTREV